MGLNVFKCFSFSVHKEEFEATTFTQEQKSVFKLERNNDVTVIVIIIDIDPFEHFNLDNNLGTSPRCVLLVSS